MSVLRIASRYAKSLFSLAKDDNNLDAVQRDMLHIEEVCKNSEFIAFLRNPIISPDRKENVFAALFKDAQPITLRTLRVVAEHKRERYLGDICEEFTRLYQKEKHISAAVLTTAEPISEELADKILAEFKAAGMLEQTVILTKKVDPSILGGFVLAFEDQLYDASIGYKIDQLETQFSENLYIKNF